MQTDLTVVVLAAGLGTRMKSKKAKVLHHAGGQTLVEHVVDSASALAPPDRIVVVIGHQAEEVRQTLDGRSLRFVKQTEQKGTGHALMVCRDTVPDHQGLLVVLYGDCPLLSAETLTGLLEAKQRTQAAATVITTELDDPSGYGRMIVDTDHYVHAIVEHKVATPQQREIRQINSGIYCFDAPLLWKHIEEIHPNPVSGEYYLTDIVEILNRAGHKVSAHLHKDANELLGINTRIELAEVDRVFRARKVRQLMLDGVTIEKPETVTVDPKVQVGMDTVVEPFAQILGTTVVGQDCRIGSGSVVRNSILGDRVVVQPLTIVNSSRIDEGADVGPFARLRVDNHVEAGAHIGNFVELKKAHLAPGVKAGHLAYLGDTSIGSKSNIGAGTITCNYDGAAKHKTTIGEGAFIGSNSTLVAPVQIGDGAYVAAGSVITKDVPADSLGIGRGHQANKEGWAKRRRQLREAAKG